jgi:hypothetical protein
MSQVADRGGAGKYGLFIRIYLQLSDRLYATYRYSVRERDTMASYGANRDSGGTRVMVLG